MLLQVGTAAAAVQSTQQWVQKHICEGRRENGTLPGPSYNRELLRGCATKRNPGCEVAVPVDDQKPTVDT